MDPTLSRPCLPGEEVDEMSEHTGWYQQDEDGMTWQ